MFRDFVPEGIRFWLILLFPLVFQASDAVFMGLNTEIAYALSMRPEDILYCGYAGMIGVTMAFPLLFRLKFHFTTRQILLIVTLSMSVISVICTTVHFLPLMVVLSFVFGMLKLWGSFECFSSIMLKVSPHYNFAPFLAVVFGIVFGGIELGGIIGTRVVHVLPWQCMNALSVGALLVLALVAFTCMRDFRPMPQQGLENMGWIGLILYGIMLLAIAFVFVYGDTIDWFHSPWTYIALAVVCLCLAINCWRMFNYSYPFIPWPAFRYRNLLPLLVLFLIGCVMLSTESVLQHIFTGEVLHFEPMAASRARWFVLGGIVVGALFSTAAIEKLGWGYKRLTFLTFLLLTMYELSLCYRMSPDTTLQQLYLPCFFYGVAHVMLFIVLTTYVEGIVPFQHRFHVLTILGFVRIGCGAACGAAFFGHFFKGEMSHNMALLGSAANRSLLATTSYAEAAQQLAEQSMLVSLRNLFAVAALMGVVTMVLVACGNFREDVKKTYPTFRRVYRWLVRYHS